ncbi:band 4.1-like protein 2 isoform X5 [Myripristis murdjan]|uniref:band 4.1-like protein 2 isoform X5 n=1 Tax=Myripristis murdjan TaxID=586833 RepID=UPI00117643A0|nr:band 4.1-like protein 2 isoform X5 [Myripristis murdjan]
MTTEAGTETEVKEKSEESAAQPDQSEKATEENQEVASAENVATEGEEKKEKDKEGKGISRFLPPWLKKQKSQSQVPGKETSPTKEAPRTQEAVAKVTEEEEGPAPAVNGHPEEVEEKEEVKLEQKRESPSKASADTQPAKEEKVEESAEKAPEEAKSTAEGEGAEEEKKEQKGEVEGEGEGETLTSIFQSPLRLVRKAKMKLVVCHVTLLDGTEFPCEVEKRAKGQYLFFKVCEHLNLLEKDYFGLTYKDNHEQRCWLDPTKEIKRQIRSNNWQFAFNVKFYPPDPSLLTEDITRYLLCLQLREDVASGRLPCSFVTHALLGSYTLQAELGDYEPEQPRPLDYISQLTFAPNQNKEMEEKILELYMSHRGMTPAQADSQFLENAKKLSMYGVDLHHAKDSEGVDIMLGVCANGLLVYKDRLRINRFAWPKILKISYKRNNFYIKIRPGEAEQFESTVGFKLPNHRSAKRLWKVCVENHSFFRLNTPEPPTKARFLTLGSKFRYSGRTQTQTRQASSLIDRPAPTFERTSSKRISRSLDGAPVISITEAGRDLASSAENGREPNLELPSDSKTTEVEIEETVVIQEVSKATKPGHVTVTMAPPVTPPVQQEVREQEVKAAEEAVALEEAKAGKQESISSESESEEEAEYHPNVAASISHTQIPEEKEEEIEEEKREEDMKVENSYSTPDAASLPTVASQSAEAAAAEAEESRREEERGKKERAEEEERAEERETEESTEDPMVTPDETPNGHTLSEEGTAALVALAEEEKEPKMNGETSLAEAEPRPQVICCSEPPVVKTEMVTISDTFAAQKTEIATKEVPIVHTETKTITYEAAQLDGSADGEPGVLMTAQTITSESLCTTTTTHITKTLKGGLSETRIEKRIVITGDADIDHDQALAQAIKEAKEQHPDMSVTRVVVHKETELAEEED